MSPVHAFTDDALGDLDAVGVAARIASGEISASEALEASLARLDQVEPTLAALAYDDRERAREVAQHLATGAFAGVPAAIKNNTDFAGIPTRNGSAATVDTPAAAHETVSQELVECGVTVVGATSLPAFGLTASTEFVDRSPTRNPWDPAFSAGASSGGSAALVAAGVLPIAHANDGGGSIRIPAAACGLVGFKPSRGRTAASAMTKNLPIDLVSNGVVTRSVRDTATFLADVERRRPATGLDPVGDVRGPHARRLTVALLNTPITGQLLDPDTDAALTRVAELLESLGHRVSTVPLPVTRSFVDDFADYWAMLAFGIDRLGSFSVGRGFDNSQIDPFTRGLSNRFARRAYRLPIALRGLRRGAKAFEELADRFDVMVSPTLSAVTPEIGFLAPTHDFDVVFERLTRLVSFTPISNISGGPAVSLPLGRSRSGLPIGIQLAAGLGADRTLLEVAYELEAAAPFARIQDA